jgi:predicted AlkP superfamily phosphohydrolase/phosphomutase
LRDEPYDFFMTSFCELHVAAHQFWHLREPDHPLYDPGSAQACGDALEQLYCAADAAVGRIMQALPPDSTLLVLTQQGVKSNFSGSHLLPEWLRRRSGAGESRGPCTALVGLASRLGSPLRAGLNRILPRAVVHSWLGRKYPAGDPAFLLPGSEFMALLRVNLRGREPSGTVALESYEQTIEELGDDILALRNPDTGRPAAARVLFPHQRYEGPCVDRLPDVVVCWADDAPIGRLECPEHGVVEGGLRFVDKTHSSHTGEGMAVLAGPQIPSGIVLPRADLQDLTATVFALLGETPPEHLEGRPVRLEGYAAGGGSPDTR